MTGNHWFGILFIVVLLIIAWWYRPQPVTEIVETPTPTAVYDRLWYDDSPSWYYPIFSSGYPYRPYYQPMYHYPRHIGGGGGGHWSGHHRPIGGGGAGPMGVHHPIGGGAGHPMGGGGTGGKH